MGQLAIIADDLSSCTDCGIQIAKNGYPTYILIDQEQDFTLGDKFDVIAIDTDSRAVSSEDAYRRVRKVADLVKYHFESIYKSVDSTLRGNLGAEIDAIMDVIPFDIAVIAPAFPFYGRTTIRGIHYLHGKPIIETEFGSDPQSPVKEANVIKLLTNQSRRKAGKIELDILHQGGKAVAKRLSELLSDKVELVVFDVLSEADLEAIVVAAASSNYRVLWVGSTGMAGYISHILNNRKGNSVKFAIPEKPAKSTMVVAGSASEVTRAQLTKYKQQFNVSSMQINPYKIILGENFRKQEINQCCTQLLSKVREGKDVVLDVASSRSDIAATQAIGEKTGLTSTQVSTDIAEALAEITSAIVESLLVDGLILTGGDTAKAICRRLEAKGILILREVEPGIPLARLIGRHEVYIITKAGGFGNADTLIHANSLLKGGW